MATEGRGERVQHVVVMRHGDRIDHFDPTWVSRAARPWDPVLTDGGKTRARATGARLSGLDFPIHRVFVSPFVRCRETAAEVLASLCSVGESDGRDASIDPSPRVKVLDDRFVLYISVIEIKISLQFSCKYNKCRCQLSMV